MLIDGTSAFLQIGGDRVYVSRRLYVHRNRIYVLRPPAGFQPQYSLSMHDMRLDSPNDDRQQTYLTDLACVRNRQGTESHNSATYS